MVDSGGSEIIHLELIPSPLCTLLKTHPSALCVCPLPRSPRVQIKSVGFFILLLKRTDCHTCRRRVGCHPKRHPRNRHQQYARHIVIHDVEPVLPSQ